MRAGAGCSIRSGHREARRPFAAAGRGRASWPLAAIAGCGRRLLAAGRRRPAAWGHSARRPRAPRATRDRPRVASKLGAYRVAGKKHSAIKRIRSRPRIARRGNRDWRSPSSPNPPTFHPLSQPFWPAQHQSLVGAPVTHSKEIAVTAPAVRLFERCSASYTPQSGGTDFRPSVEPRKFRQAQQTQRPAVRARDLRE